MGFLFLFLLLSFGPFMMVMAFFNKLPKSKALTKELKEAAIRSSVEREKAIIDAYCPHSFENKDFLYDSRERYHELVLKSLQQRISAFEGEAFAYPPSMDAPEWDEIKQIHQQTLANQPNSLDERHTYNLLKCDTYCKKINELVYVLNDRNKDRFKAATNKLHKHRLINRTFTSVCESDVDSLIEIRKELINLYAVVESYRLQEIRRMKGSSLRPHETSSAPFEERKPIKQTEKPRFPQVCLAIEQSIVELIVKITNKKSSLGNVEAHRFETLQIDYQELKDAYFSYEETHRDDLLIFLKDGLEGIESKLTEIHASLLEGGQYRIRHRVEVIRNR